MGENIESKSDPLSKHVATTVIAQMKFFTDLEAKPKENMATLRTVTQVPTLASKPPIREGRCCSAYCLVSTGR